MAHSSRAPVWRKSSYSSTPEGNCVEVADLDARIGVRDSKDPNGPSLKLTHAEFRSLREAIRRDGHNL